jgi:enoyl-CoA hydratase/carnithine racemase
MTASGAVEASDASGASAGRPVRVSRCGPDGSVLWVQVDSPPVNALAAPVRSGLIAAAAQAHDESVRVAVLTGNAHCFSAGGDIRELASLEDPAVARHVHADYLELYRSWYAVPVPTIAAIRGYALGGALELALSCDLRYATAESFFAASGVKMGLVESAHSLPTVVPDTIAAEMLFTAHRVPAAEAVTSGLLTRVVADLDADTAAVAEAIAAHPPHAVRATKAVLRASRGAGRGEAAELAISRWRELQREPVHREIASAFLAR